jgi:nitrate reductase NapE component
MTETVTSATSGRMKVGRILNAWIAFLVLSFTVLTAVSVGIVAAYCAVSGILFAFGNHAQPQRAPKPVLVAHAQAGAD